MPTRYQWMSVKLELIMFKSRIKKIYFDVKSKLNGKWLYPTKSVQYLGIKIYEGYT